MAPSKIALYMGFIVQAIEASRLPQQDVRKGLFTTVQPFHAT
jgi:hypothetical protein